MKFGMQHMKNRATFSKFIYDLHNLVNVMLGKPKYKTYEDSLDFIVNQAMFTPINMTVEEGAAKKKQFTKNVLENGLPKSTLLNVNFPLVQNFNELKGVKICRQAVAKWQEEFDERLDPHKRKYYWLTGVFELNDEGQDTDEWALKNNYVSVVPVQFDLTAYDAIDELANWKFSV